MEELSSSLLLLQQSQNTTRRQKGRRHRRTTTTREQQQQRRGLRQSRVSMSSSLSVPTILITISLIVLLSSFCSFVEGHSRSFRMENSLTFKIPQPSLLATRRTTTPRRRDNHRSTTTTTGLNMVLQSLNGIRGGGDDGGSTTTSSRGTELSSSVPPPPQEQQRQHTTTSKQITDLVKEWTKAVHDILPNREKFVDIVITGLGMVTTFTIMGYMEKRGIKLLVPPMMASAIAFNAAPTPPSIKGFLMGTIGCALISKPLYKTVAIHFKNKASGAATASGSSLLSLPKSLPYDATGMGTACASLLMWFKTMNCGIFPPTAVIPILMIGQNHPYRWILQTWIPGNLMVYCGAIITSKARSRIKYNLFYSQKKKLQGGMSLGETASALLSNKTPTTATDDREQLKRIFKQFDTSGDNALDANELKCALRVTTGLDLSLKVCESLVKQMDKDGNGVVDFDEFIAITKEQLGQ